VAWGLERPGLGLSLGGAHDTARVDQHRSWVLRAESLGLHSVWLPEMHFAPGVCPAPLIELAGFAALTTRLRLATTSLLLPLHPAERLAAEIAALDRISGGRLLVGLGRGFQRPMLEAFGVDPAQKRDRFDATLDRILTCWSESPRPKGGGTPGSRLHPPLAVAAFGPKGLAQAARRGLPYLASPMESLGQIAENQRRHREGLPDPGLRPLSLVMRTVFVAEDERDLRAARSALERELPRVATSRMPAAIHEALSAPLDERAVIGTPEAVAERLSSIRERLDLDLLIVRPQIPGMGEAALERSLAWLAERVWPAVLCGNA